MTIDEVLRLLQSAFPGLNAKAMEAWAPVYRAQLAQHEGPRLRDAHVAVMGAFKPSGRTPFPVPAEYTAHMPSTDVHKALSTMGPAIDLAGHRRRKNALVEDWQAGQGAKVKAARGDAIYGHCLWDAQRLASARAWSPDPLAVVLSAEQIQTCEDQAVSSARMDAHGASPLRFADGVTWRAQMDNCRAMLRANQQPPRMREARGEGATLEPSPAMRKRLAELARARRMGTTALPVERRDGAEVA